MALTPSLELLNFQAVIKTDDLQQPLINIFQEYVIIVLCLIVCA